MVASLWHQLLGTKVRLLVRLLANVMMRGLTVNLDSRISRQLTNSLKTGLLRYQSKPFRREYSGELWGGEDAVLRMGWYEPILVGGLTYIGRHRDLYSFVVGSI